MRDKDNLKRGEKALLKVLKTGHDVKKAMYRKEVGQIDFLWGTPGKKSLEYKGGWGISHALAKHGLQDVLKIPMVLLKGKVSSDLDNVNKKIIQYKKYFVILGCANKSKSFVITGYYKKNDRSYSDRPKRQVWQRGTFSDCHYTAQSSLVAKAPVAASEDSINNYLINVKEN